MVFASEPQPPVDSPGLLSATRRYRVLVAALTVAGVVLAALFTIVQPSTPAAEARMTLVDPRGTAVLSGGGSQQLDATRYVADRMEVASSSTALGIAAKAMGKGVTTGELRDACSVSAVPESTTLVLSCSLSSASDSTRAVTELAAAYRSVTKDDLASKAAATTSAIERERVALLDRIAKAGAEEDDPDVRAATLESATSRLAALDQRESAIATSLSLFGDGVDFFDPARTVEGSGLIAQLVRNAFVGGALGFIIALVIAWFRADRAPIAQRSDDVAELLDLPVLGEVNIEDAGADLDLLSVPAPEFMLVASNLSALFDRGVAMFVAITGIDGYAETVVKTALVAARAGKRVLLIDADHAADSPSRLVGLSEGPGLAELLGGQVAEDEVTARISFGFAPGLSEAVFHVMGPGDRTTELAALARADRAESVIGSLRSRYDLVLIAPPPLLASATGTAVGQLADGVIVAVKPGMSTNTLVGARRQLSFLGAERLGFVMIDAGRRSGA
ncbi:MAG: hypothetical protein V9E99_04855 [Microthrixaceae bacterium]|jgi:succinoglycan biosynthesis transport protein ExoP|nr:hypothetical protein [Actinomycetota bacterium]